MIVKNNEGMDLRAYPLKPIKKKISGDKQMKIFQRVSVIALLTVVVNCTPLEDYRQFLERDIKPPMFISMGTLDPKTLEIQFSEELSSDPEYLYIDPVIEISSVKVEKDSVIYLTP